MQQHDSSISNHKLSVAWPNANNVFVLSVCMQMNVWLCLCVTVDFWEAWQRPGASSRSHICFVYSSFSGPSAAYMTSALVTVIFCFDPCCFNCLIITLNKWANFVPCCCFSYQLSFPLFFSVPWVLNLIYCGSFNCLPHASLLHWHFLMNLSSLGPHTEAASLTIGAARPACGTFNCFSWSLTAEDTWWICHHIYLWHGKGRSLYTLKNIHGQMRTSAKCG